MEINSLKIRDFRGLHNLQELNFDKINIITAPGNFGKTSIIQAIVASMNFDDGNHILKTANIFKNSRCRDFDYFRQLMRNEDGIYTYDISAVFDGIEIQKMLCGKFTNGQRFCGEYYRSLNNKKLSLKQEIQNPVEFSRDTEEKYTESGIICPQFSYFDFEKINVSPVLEFKNRNMKDSLKEYLMCFDDEITDFKVSDRKFYIKHRRYGTMPAECLGSTLYKCIEFSNFCDKSSGKILFLENIDTVCSPENREMFIKLLVSHIWEMNCQVFITLRNRELGELIAKNLRDSGLDDGVNYINLLRTDDKITVEHKQGETAAII